MASDFGVVPEPDDLEALSLDPNSLGQLPAYPEEARPQDHTNLVVRMLKRADVLLVLLLVVALVGIVLANLRHKSSQASVATSASQEFDTVKLPLGGFVVNDQGVSFGTSSVAINGSLKVNDGLIVTPSVQPNAPTSGQLYFDQNTKQLAYYNGAAFVPLTAQSQPQVVQSVGGLNGAITLGGGLTTVGNQLVAVNNGVTSLGGQTGAIAIGTGLKLTANGLQNAGVLSVAAGSNITVTNDGNGNYTITNTGAGTGTVTSSGSTAGTIAMFDAAQNITDSLLSQSATTITASGDLNVVGGLSLGNALSVSNGGTGATSLANNGVVVSHGTGAFTSVTAGGAGLCLLSTGGAPAFGACPGNAGVTTLDGLGGALTLANSSGAGSVVTIDDATTGGAKGIASFNATNFSAASGVVNTIQDINTTAAPSFGRLTVSSGQAAAGMLLINNTNLAATGNLLDLQLGGVSKFSVQPSGAVSTSGAINGQTISSSASFTGTLGVTGNTTLSGTLAVNGGTLSSTGALAITPSGTLTAGSGTQTLALQGSSASTIVIGNGGNTTTVSFQAPGAAVTYRVPTAAAGNYDFCTTAGNCVGTGGGVTSAGGSTDRLSKFTGSQTIGDSSISDNGTLVTTTANIAIQGGTATVGVANSQTGTLALAYGSANFTGSVTVGTLTANRTYTLPDVSGTICLNSGNCLGGGGGGANTALSNLSGVAINTSLLPGATTIDLGSGSAPFRNLYISGSSASPGTNNFQLTGTATAARTITLPDSSGTICLNNSTNCGFLTGVGTAFVQNGNTLGATAVLGAADTQGLNLITDNVARLSITAAGSATFSSNVAINGSTLSSAAALNITPAGTLTVGATNQALTLQGNASTTLTATGGGFTTTVGFTGSPAGAVTYNFDRAAAAGTYTICTTIGNCVGSGGGVSTSGGSTNRLSKFTGSQTIGDSSITDNAGLVSTTGNLTVQGGTATVGVANSQTGILSLAYGSANFSGSLTQGTLTASRTYTLPDADGTVCLSSGNCLGGGGGGANTALSNLSSVALNVSLLPGSTTIDLGSSSAPFRNLYIAGSSVSPGTNNFTITGTATAPRTLTLPDATGTVCLNGAAACGFATGSGSAFTQSGNSFGATGVLGTNDNNGLNIRTNGNTALALSAAGDTTLTGNLTINGSTLSSAGALSITPGSSLTVGATGQTLTLQGNASTTLTATGGGFTTTVGFANSPVGAVRYDFDRSVAAGTYNICTSIGNCAGSGSGVTTAGGTSGTIAVFTGTQAIGNSLLSQSGGTVSANANLNLTTGHTYQINSVQISSADLSNDANIAKLSASQTFSGAMLSFKNSGSDSTNAFNIQNVGGARLLTADTTNGTIILGTSTTLDGKLVFNNVTNSNTTTIVPGTPTAPRTITLPNDSGTICLSTGNCAGAGATLQTAYNFSVGGTTPKIKLNSTLNGVDIQDADTTIGADLLDVRASNGAGLGAVLFGVGNTGQITLQNSSNSSTALAVKTLGGTRVLTVDTSAGSAVLGQSTSLGGQLVFNNASNSNQTILNAAAPASGNRTLTLPDSGAVICTDSGNCASSGGGVTTAGGTTNRLAKFTGSQAIGNSIVTDNGTTVTVNGDLVLQDAGATETLLTADTSARGAGGGNRIKVGNSTGTDGALTILQLDSAISDPTSNLAALNGGLFYNSVSGKVSLIENGQVKIICNTTDLGCGTGTVSLQNAYGNSSTSQSEIILNNSQNGIDIQDRSTSNSGTIGANLLNIRATAATDATLGTILFGVGNTGSIAQKTTTDSVTAFTIQNSANAYVLDVDTTNKRVGIGTNAPIAQLHIAGLVPTSTTGSVSTTEGGYDIVTQGRYAYVVTAGKFRIFDVTRSGSMSSLGNVNTASGGDLVVQGKYAYVAAGTGTNLYIIDISNPSSPSIVSTTNFGTALQDVAVAGRYAFALTTSGISAYDVTNPASPRSLSSLTLTGSVPQNIVVKGKYAYVTSDNKFYVVDISNPSSMSSAGNLVTTQSYHLDVVGRYAYVIANSGSNLQAIDVSNPASPSSASSFGLGGSPVTTEITVRERYAYIGYGVSSNGIDIVDVSNPTSMSTVGLISAPGGINGVSVLGRYAYATDWSNNNLLSYDLGGEYAQQLEVGGLEAGAATVNGQLIATGEVSLQSSVSVGQNLAVGGTLGVTGSALFQNASDSTSALQVRNAAGTAIALNVDTSNTRVGIGTATPSRTLDVATSDTNTTAPAFRLQQASTGDATMELNTQGGSLFLGSDNSDGGSFKLSTTTASGGAITVGLTASTYSNIDTGNSNTVSATQVTTNATGGTLNYVRIYFLSAAGNAQIGVYSDTGSDAPATLLSTSASQSVVEGWNTFAMPNVALTGSTKYWIGFNVTDSTMQYPYINGGRAAYQTTGATYGSWPSPFGTPVATSGETYLASMTYATAGAIDSFAGNVLTVSNTGATIFKNTLDSTTAFRVQNSSANSILTVNTTDSATANVITNGGFEKGITGWAKKGGPFIFGAASNNKHSGMNSLYISSSPTANDGAKYNVTLADSTTYIATFYGRVGSDQPTMTTLAAGYSSDGSTDNVPCTLSTTTLVATGWNRIECTFVTPGSHSGTPYFYMKQTDATARDIYVDDFLLAQDTAGVSDTNTNGSIDLQGAISSPLLVRPGANTTDALRVQNATSTSILNIGTLDISNIIDNPSFELNYDGWIDTTNSAITQDQTQAWAGTASLKIVTNNTANAGAAFITGNTAPTKLNTSTTYALSWYAKLSSGTFTDIKGRYSRNGGTNFVECTPTAQTVSTSGWTRFTCSFTTDGTSPTGSADVRIVQTAAGTARTFWIDGVRLEQGSVANTYGAGTLALDAVVNSSLMLRNTSDSTTALNIQNSAGTTLFNVDSLNQSVSVSGSGGLTVSGLVNAGTFSGAGLTDCDASNSKLLWDTTSKQFSCGTDRASQTIRKPADESVTSSTALQNDDDLSFSVGAGETWAFQINGVVKSSATGDFKIALNLPSGYTSCRFTIINTYETTEDTRTICDDANSITMDHSDAGEDTYIMYGTFVTGGSGGTAQFRWAQGTSSGTSTIFRADSYLVAYKLSGADLAEAYYTHDNSVQPGDVVSVDGSLKAGVKKTSGIADSTAMGIVSTEPGMVLGDKTATSGVGKPVLLALNGRVPVKVSLENGPIKAGDYLTTSSTPGVAMKATQPGQMIGKALEDFSNANPNAQSLVMAFANLTWANPATGATANNDLQGSALSAPQLNVSGTATVGNLVVTGNASVKNLVVGDLATTKDLVVNGTASFAGDIRLQGVGLSRNAITKQFKASKPITIGSVVIVDPAHDGQVTTTATPGDTRVLGVALTEAHAAGDEISVAIGGSVQVRTVSGASIQGGDLLTSGNQDGLADKSSAPTPGSMIGKALSKPVDDMTWLIITLN